MSDAFLEAAAAAASYSREKMAKSTLWQGDRLMIGLNAFLPGQEHALHHHEGVDKAYLVLEGEGKFTIGDESRTLGPGGLAIAAAGVPHGVKNRGKAPLLVLVHMAPPPAPKRGEPG